jgi:hypothetical protein
LQKKLNATSCGCCIWEHKGYKEFKYHIVLSLFDFLSLVYKFGLKDHGLGPLFLGSKRDPDGNVVSIS